MKVRNGFVSNSSSSSFIIISKNGKLDKSHLTKAFEGCENTPFKSLIPGVVESLGSVEEHSLNKFIVDELGYETIEEYLETRLETTEKKAVRLLSEHPEWKLYSGSAGDQDDFEEGVLCALDLDYEDENIVVIKDAYY